MKRLLIVLAAAAALLGAAAPVSVPKADIDAENARWTSFGVKLPPGGIVLEHPYSPPYSNRSFVVPLSWYTRYYTAFKAHNDYPVRASDLRRDLPVLQFLLPKVYAGYAPAKARGWNWNRWFAAWDAQLAKSGNTELGIAQAFAPWGRYERFQLDNHSGVASYRGFMSGSASAVLARRPSGACSLLRFTDGHTLKLNGGDAGQQPHNVQQWNGAAFSPATYVSYPAREGSAVSIECAGAAIAVHAAGESGTIDNTPSYTLIGDGIAYVRMPTFTDANDEALRAALAKAPNLGKERVVLLDLRGNDGGNVPADVLNNWIAESAIENADELEQIGTQSCFATALTFGLQQQLMENLKPPVSSGAVQFLQSLADMLRPPSNCAVTPTVQHSQTSLRDHRFSVAEHSGAQPRLIAVVDNLCGSDCEFMAKIVAGLPDSVLAGTSTYGVMGYTQPGYFVLPHTGVPFRLALSKTDAYGDGRSVDGYGISVDVLLPNAQSQSRESLVALAKALAP